MAEWIPLPAAPFFYQPDQQDFLKARKLRLCETCKDELGNPKEFIAEPPNGTCPGCDKKGVREFDRLTIIAGRRFGKSKIGSVAGVEEACIANSIGWACAPTNPKLHRYVIPAFRQLIPKEWVADWSVEHNDLLLKNGSLIHFQTLEHPDQGRGQGLDWLWIDEVCELTDEHWNVIEPSLGDKQGVAFFTTSPRSYDWVYERLYKPAEDKFILTPEGERKDVSGFWALHARTADNPIFQTPRGKEFLEQQKATMPGTMYRQEYEADFVVFTGSVYGSALDTQILRTREAVQDIIPEWPEIAPWRQVLVGLDTGADHPFGAVRLVSTEKGLVAVGEYLERHKSFIQHAGELHRLALGGTNTPKWACNKNERQGMIELAQHGIYCIGAENDVVSGTERVKTWLHQGQLWLLDPSACAGSRFEGVPRTIKQMKAYRWAPDKSSDGSVRKEKVFKKDDELPDCLRYAVMTWPQLPKIAVAPEGRDISTLSPDQQRDIMRIRKFDGKLEEKEFESIIAGDFWA